MNKILSLYDEQKRKNAHYYGARTEKTPDVVRLIDEMDWQGMVIYSHLDESNVDRVIREQVAFYQGIGQDFEWKYFSHDTPADLKDRLAGQGFEVEEAESVMVLDLEIAPAIFFEPVIADIRRITHADEIAQLVGIMNVVWEEDHENLGRFLTDEFTNNGDYLSIYMAYEGGIPVSAAWIRFQEDSQFAELLGGSTLKEYRKRGLYTALLALRAQEARGRGVRYLTIDASPMSAPIVARHGFQMLAISHPCTYTVKEN